MFYITLGVCFIATILLTPLVKKIAFAIGAVDRPAKRKVHETKMPRAGGLAIFFSFLLGYYILQPQSTATVPILLGAVVIIMTGLLDDMYELSPKLKLTGQLLAAAIIVLYGDIQVHFINLPFNGRLELGLLSVPLTILWILAITNAINLIDGLDGLAAGVSSIVLFTISIMALVMGNMFVMSIAGIVLLSTLAFLVFNFHPAKIFMGDTGSLFLGYMISVLSLLGFKNVTLFSLVVPVIILGVPISDTLFAIIRRLLNKKPLSAPDQSHLHHCLLRLGFSHRQTVLLIYAMSAICGIAAILFSASTLWGGLFIIVILLVAVELVVEKVGLLGSQYQPVLKVIRRYKN